MMHAAGITKHTGIDDDFPKEEVAPGEGFEPPTGWLTATCSAS